MAAVTYSGFYGPNVNDYSLLDGKMPMRAQIKRVVNMDGFRAFTALFNGLIGAAAGSNVTATHKRVDPAAVINTVGTQVIDPGQPQILTVTDINRNTTAADVTALKEMVYNVQLRPVPYPRDLSGNGGPALS
jgi:hypothetical protein